MNKREIVQAVVEKDRRLTKMDVSRVLEALPLVFCDELTKKGGVGKLYFRDIGTFTMQYVPKRSVLLKFGEDAGKYKDIKETYRIKFKPAEYLKRVIKDAF